MNAVVIDTISPNNSPVSVESVRVALRRKDSKFGDLTFIREFDQLLLLHPNIEQIESFLAARPSAITALTQFIPALLTSVSSDFQLDFFLTRNGIASFRAALVSSILLSVLALAEVPNACSNEVIIRLICRARLARSLAENLFCVDEDQVMVGGLLMECGYPILFSVESNEALELWNHKSIQLVQGSTEPKDVYFCPQDIALSLAEELKLPKACHVMIDRHRLMALARHPEVVCAQIATATIWAADQLGMALNPIRSDARLPDDLCQQLHIKPDDLLTSMKSIRDSVVSLSNT